MTTRRLHITWRTAHRWIGLLMAVLMLPMCISGIILNHRQLFAGCSVSRSLLPAGYRIADFNNGVVRGTLEMPDGHVLVYGNSGLWLTDTAFTTAADFNAGLPRGIDRRTVRNVTRTADGRLWCATQFGVYSMENGRWREHLLPGNDERLTDLTLTPDSTSVVAVTRSAVYPLTAAGFARVVPAAPEGHKERVTLMRTLWLLHSGELFGLPGQLVVDAVALVIAFLCVTGIILFVLPYALRRRIGARAKRMAGTMKWNIHWHNRTGYVTIFFTLLIALTGMCLRPPLMIPCVMTSTAPLPGSTLHSPNAWHDKLRALRWEPTLGRWLMATSSGFALADADFGSVSLLDRRMTPPVSPMGVNVMETTGPGQWLIGSFSGLYRWNLEDGSVTDSFTDESLEAAGSHGRTASHHLVSGYSTHFGERPVTFDYSIGADGLKAMPEVLAHQPMSLWNFALELHVGRCYAPVLGPLSGLYVFLSGLLLIVALISGLVIHNRMKRHQ